MHGEVTLNFEPFRISENGNFEEVTTVTLRAPALGKRHVHITMQTWVMEAFSEMQRKRPELFKAEVESSVAIGDEDAPKAVKKNNEDPHKEAKGMWQMMQMGLGHDVFPRFADYVMNELTGSPRLATVGENGVALTESAWEAIVDANGMDTIAIICGTFVGFFTGDQKSPKGNGSATSPSSSSRAKAGSRSSTRTASHSQN